MQPDYFKSNHHRAIKRFSPLPASTGSSSHASRPQNDERTWWNRCRQTAGIIELRETTWLRFDAVVAVVCRTLEALTHRVVDWRSKANWPSSRSARNHAEAAVERARPLGPEVGTDGAPVPGSASGAVRATDLDFHGQSGSSPALGVQFRLQAHHPAWAQSSVEQRRSTERKCRWWHSAFA